MNDLFLFWLPFRRTFSMFFSTCFTHVLIPDHPSASACCWLCTGCCLCALLSGRYSTPSVFLHTDAVQTSPSEYAEQELSKREAVPLLASLTFLCQGHSPLTWQNSGVLSHDRRRHRMITIWLLLLYIQPFAPAVGALFGSVLSLVPESRG